MLAGQARKALYILEKYVYSYTTLTTSHVADLFDKLILPILNYCCEVWGFIPANTIERVHLQFCKKNYLGLKRVLKMILFTANSAELHYLQGDVILLSNTGLKF